jgi:hypothetical protein
MLGEGAKFVPTHNFNQDPWEQYFVDISVTKEGPITIHQYLMSETLRRSFMLTELKPWPQNEET